MEMKLTAHARDAEHQARMEFALTKIGLGEIYKEELVPHKASGGYVWFRMTTTALVLILNEDKTKIVTSYMATPVQVDGICSKVYKHPAPDWLRNKAHKNWMRAKKCGYEMPKRKK